MVLKYFTSKHAIKLWNQSKLEGHKKTQSSWDGEPA
jgi:hypothetical protein